MRTTCGERRGGNTINSQHVDEGALSIPDVNLVCQAPRRRSLKVSHPSTRMKVDRDHMVRHGNYVQ